MNDLLIKRKLEIPTNKKHQQLFKFPIEDYYQNLGYDFSKESFFALHSEFLDLFKKRLFECSLHKHVQLVLPHLNKMGISHSILSAQAQKAIEFQIKHYNISKYFTNIVGLKNDLGTSKIENAINLISKLYIERSKLVIIGDTLHDFEVSKIIGVDCILFTGGYNTIEMLKATKSRVIRNLKELI